MSNSELMIKVNEAVWAERLRQNVKWGVQRHELGKWLAILMEEVGEVAQAMQPRMGLNCSKETDKDDLYKECIQVAAVASAIAEQVKESYEYEAKS